MFAAGNALDAAPTHLDTEHPDEERGVEERGVVERRCRAMNTDVRFVLVDPYPGAEAALAQAQALFERVERTCTRFDASSDLMRANAAGNEGVTVAAECFAAIEAAAHAHRVTGGLFDPRILGTLQRLGYDRTLPFGQSMIELAGPASQIGPQIGPEPGPELGPAHTAATALPLLTLSPPRSASDLESLATREPWRPDLARATRRVRIGPDPIDLGGIGKGLAVRWAGEILHGRARGYLIDAGGDCLVSGPAPDGGRWRIGVEDPAGAPVREEAGEQPLAVLELDGGACATSSTRKRTWRLGGRQIHHVIDPRTQRSAASSLAAVSVLGDDPATAEVWSKTLLIAGPHEAAALARRHALAALWIERDGRISATSAIKECLIWQNSEVTYVD